MVMVVMMVPVMMVMAQTHDHAVMMVVMMVMVAELHGNLRHLFG